jgi:uncharacterized sporulation protein YeaH/YhbH (DUF444 family)
MPELVDYAYIAEKLNVSQQTVRVYATGTKQRKAGFPKSALPEGARSPLFHKKEADAFIKRRREETAGDSDQEEAAQNAYAELGREINLRSREQLQVALFEDLGLPRTEDLSVSTPALKKLYEETGSAFVGHVLRFRGK